jgi:hypothetical protein
MPLKGGDDLVIDDEYAVDKAVEITSIVLANPNTSVSFDNDGVMLISKFLSGVYEVVKNFSEKK